MNPSKKPKMLLVADTFHPKVDGTMIFMKEFMRKSQKTFDLSLLVPDLGKHESHNIIYVKTSKRISLSGYPLIKFSFKNLRIIKKSIKKSDIIFVQGPALLSYLSIYYGHRYNKTTIFYTHTIAWELFEKFAPPILNKFLNKIVKWFSIFSYNRCAEILVPYKKLQTYLKKLGVKSPVEVAKLGVDISKFSPTENKTYFKNKIGIPGSKKIIGYVGRMSKEKNAQILYEAFKRLDNQENLHLLMVGDGPEDQTSKFRKLKNCTVTGFRNDIESYVKAMDIFVMPSLTETTSLATLEAMATGIPVIVSKVGFIKDYVRKNHNGQFFPKNSSKILAIKLSKLLNDPEMREKLGKNARKTVIYSFSWERSINRIKRLILSKYRENL
jgi:glycosyltransferase involved in cell wall biosynthesis